jgi:hypothetical protein
MRLQVHFFIEILLEVGFGLLSMPICPKCHPLACLLLSVWQVIQIWRSTGLLLEFQARLSLSLSLECTLHNTAGPETNQMGDRHECVIFAFSTVTMWQVSVT